MVLKNTKLNWTTMCIVLLLLVAGLTGIIPSTVQAVLVIGLCALLLLTDDLYLVYPIMIFYYSPFGQFAGMSVYRYFSIMFFLSVLLRHFREKFTLKWYVALTLAVMSSYALITFSSYNLRSALFLIFDILCIFILVKKYLLDDDKLKKFFTVYCFAAMLAFLTGVITGGVVENEVMNIEGEEVSRFNATFEDPNYMGFFYTIAIFSVISLKLFKPWLRIIIVIALYMMMLASLSMTAIVVNILVWMVYLVLTKKLKVKTFIVIILVAAVLVALYNYGLENSDTPILGALSYRIDDKLSSLFSRDYDELTTNRTLITDKHLQYFNEQSVFKKLFGLNVVTSTHTMLGSVAHNELVDMMLNVGIVGMLALMLCYLYRTIEVVVLYVKTKEPKYICITVLKAVWLCYALTLTMFADFRFMLMFFI